MKPKRQRSSETAPATRQRDKAAVRESVLSETIIDSFPGMFYVLDSRGRLVRWNRALEEITGLPAGRLRGMEGVRTIHEDDRARVAAEIKEVFVKGRAMAEARLLARDGTRHFLLTGRRMNVDGDLFLVGAGIDISARERLGETLRASEQRYHLAVDFSYDWEYWIDPEGRFVYCSPSCERITGRQAAAFVAAPGLLRRLIHPADQAAYDRHVRQHRRRRQPGQADWRIRHIDGTWRWIEHRCRPVFGDEGEYLGIRVSNRDVSDRKRLEEELQKSRDELELRVEERTRELREALERLGSSEARFRAIYEHGPLGIALGDLQGRLTSANPAFHEMLGYDEGDLFGKSFRELSSDEDLPAENLLAEEVLAGKLEHYDIEKRYVRKDGRPIWAAVSVSVLRGTGGVPALGLAMARDITARKEAEATLARANRALRAITACSEALLRCTTESELLRVLCEIMVTIGGYRMAWVGMAEHDRQKTVRRVAHAGFPGSYLTDPGITWADTKLGQGPAGTAIRTGKPVVRHDLSHDTGFRPWRRHLRKLGATAAVALPLVAEGRCFGALTIFAADPLAFNPEEVRLLTQLANDLAYGVTGLRGRSARIQLEKQLVEISEREQRRIGQDLHDGLGQLISGARFHCEATARQLARDKLPAAQDVMEIGHLLSEAVEQVRRIARGLHPVQPGADSLMAALDELADTITRMSRIPCQFLCRRPVLVTEHEAATHLYRIAQEAAGNAARHGSPRHIRIRLGPANGGVRLRIEDDGCGLPVTPATGSGLGLGIMKHRAEMIGATIAIAPRRGGGTAVTCVWKPASGRPNPRRVQSTGAGAPDAGSVSV